MDILNIASDEGLIISFSSNPINLKTRVYISLYPGKFDENTRIMSDEKFIKIITEIRDRLRNEGYLKIKPQLRLKKKRVFDIFYPKKHDIVESDDITVMCWNGYPRFDYIPINHEFIRLDSYPYKDYTIPQQAIIDLNVRVGGLYKTPGWS